MDTFTQAVEGWHDFYLLIGTAAATLVGLLFVGLSLNIDVITREANADLRVLAAQAFTNFLNVVMLAVLFLIPRQVPPGLGLPLLGISGYGLYENHRKNGRDPHADLLRRGACCLQPVRLLGTVGRPRPELFDETDG
jgi:hypothetical protein